MYFRELDAEEKLDATPLRVGLESTSTNLKKFGWPPPSDKRDRAMKRRIAMAYAVKVMDMLMSVSLVGSVFADTKVVDPSGHGDYATIQAAVNDLPNPGPRTVVVRAGTYHEAVAVSDRNTLAAGDSERIVLLADTNAASGAVIITPPSGSSGIRLSGSGFITVEGVAITGVSGKGVPAMELDGDASSNADIAIVGCQIYNNGSHGIQVGSGNARTWIMNDLIHDNGSATKSGHGMTIAAASGATVYVVNNTVVRNKSDGVYVGAPRPVYVVNNLVVGNTSYGFQRAAGANNPSEVTLLNNFLYANKKNGDIANASQTMGNVDSGNRTTTGTEGVGVAGCAFSNCGRTAGLTALFVNPAVTGGDYHLAAASPAIDSGVNSFSDGTATWLIADDLEGHSRPQDGRGDCLAMADVGCYEATAIPCQMNTIPPLDSLLLGDGGLLISNVNAETLGGIPSADFTTLNGRYLGMTVGTATFAAQAGMATYSANAGTAAFANTATYAINAGIANFAVSSGYATNAGSAPVPALSNVLAVANISGTGIVMNARDPTRSFELSFVDGAGSTNVLYSSGADLVHMWPSGVTGTVIDTLNLPYPASTNGAYPTMSVGSATFSAFATDAGTSTNALQLGGLVAGAYSTSNQLTAASNTLAVATFGVTNGLETITAANILSNVLAGATYVVTNGLETITAANSLSNMLAATTFVVTNGLETIPVANGLSNTLAAATYAVTNGLETITAANTLSNTLAAATALKLDITATNALDSIALLTSTSNTLAAATALKLNITATNTLAPITLVTSTSNTLAAATALKLDITATNALDSIALLTSTSNTLAAATALKLNITTTNTLAPITLVTSTSNTLAAATALKLDITATNALDSLALLTSTSNTLAAATALKLNITATNTLAPITLVTSTSNMLATATQAITNGLETITAATSESNTLAAATALKLDITSTNALDSIGLLTSTSNTLAGATMLKLDITATNVLASVALVSATSNTLATATALKLDITATNALDSIALLTSTSNALAAATAAITNGLPTGAITNGLETVTAANSLTNGLAAIDGSYGGMSVGTATFAATAGAAASASAADVANFATGSSYATNAGTATFAATAGAAPAESLSSILAAGNDSGTDIVIDVKDSATSYGIYFVDGSGNTNGFLGSGSSLVHIAPTATTGTVWDTLNLASPASVDGSYSAMSVGTATFAANAGTATYAATSGYADSVPTSLPTNTAPLTISNMTVTLNVPFTNWNQRAEFSARCGFTAAADANAGIWFTNLTDSTAEIYSIGGVAATVTNQTKILANPNDVLMLTNTSDDGATVVLIGVTGRGQ
ncbi:MAG TPA: right-handed parallel beta-helix repeat-containing protein [Verrucomicrobiae bacterium]|nr:right-handed parallel beta-helix repeat-containing protein [Verrucomicrobiae bacterium]